MRTTAEMARTGLLIPVPAFRSLGGDPTASFLATSKGIPTVYTIITTPKQADQATAQLTHIGARIVALHQESESIRDDITRVILNGGKTGDLLSKRSKVDADLRELEVSEQDLQTSLTEWHTLESIRVGRVARQELEAITAEAREVERQYLVVMESAHALLDQIDVLRKRHRQALAIAQEHGGLAPDAGTGRPIQPKPSYPRVHRFVPRPPRETLPTNLPGFPITLDEVYGRKGAA